MDLGSEDRFSKPPMPARLIPEMDIGALQSIVASDRGGRGVSGLSCPSLWEKALSLCLAARSVLILTGFFIRSSAAPETDGPPGAAILGRALTLVGRRVCLATDRYNFAALAACSGALGGDLEVLCWDVPDSPNLSEFDLLIFLERPGRAKDGRYYNMRGEDITSVVIPLDELAFKALDSKIPVLGIGDGGNEAGMGALYEPLVRTLPHYAPFLSCVPSTVCVPVDVSNWGGYALAALLSLVFGRWVGLDDGEEERMLTALQAEGAVDGVSGLCGRSVDGFALPELAQVSTRIRCWYAKQSSVLS